MGLKQVYSTVINDITDKLGNVDITDLLKDLLDV
jgi:hypothetical protein